MTHYDDYARIDETTNTVVVRYSIHDAWHSPGWPFLMAREFGQYIIELSDKAERANPKVRQLMADLEIIEEDLYITATESTYEEIALALVRKGYHK